MNNRFIRSLDLANIQQTEEKDNTKKTYINPKREEFILNSEEIEKIQISLRIPKNLLSKIDKKAKQTGHNRTYIINWLIENKLEL